MVRLRRVHGGEGVTRLPEDQQMVLDYLRTHGPVYSAQIREDLGIDPTRALSRLIDKGLVRKAESRREHGRPWRWTA